MVDSSIAPGWGLGAVYVADRPSCQAKLAKTVWGPYSDPVAEVGSDITRARVLVELGGFRSKEQVSGDAL